MSSQPNLRPLSPHLQVYKPQITSVLSITHRVTGIGLSLGIFFFLYWLGAIAMGADSFAEAIIFFKSWFGQLVLGLCLLGFYYHFANGIRHLAWDLGYGFSLRAVHVTGWTVVIAAVLLTLLTWMSIK
ncbi:succinate dehydrogenase, cytochrome b556 subunit [Candidatus Paracaedibacter symbiosus]|uniref:succinate dehydrogenase, cytochrome b556 subunit n=1 Tax=Candidatus Paracaedibacter symbiosus TaxID=244582 RepID=UPI000509A4FD|nr:succinate dehydrogenase, cytochrome b556 subunit [Candidatus Paracaedibacter symbiosus]